MVSGKPSTEADRLAVQERFEWRLKERNEKGLASHDWSIEMRIERLSAALVGAKDSTCELR